MNPIVFISGPTASGKSAWAIELAKKMGDEIINADALQVYEDLQILSARPTLSDMQGIPHHLFGHVSGSVRYSTGQWLREVQPIILECLARGVVPILTGGTGLYFKALLKGLAEIPAISTDVFEDVKNTLRSKGISHLRDKTERIDPVAAGRVLGDDPQRLSRILCVYKETGQTLTQWHAKTRPIIPEQFCNCAVLLPEREALYRRINQRFSQMVDNGGLAEAERVLSKAYDSSLPMMKAIGLQQLSGYFTQETSLSESIELASRDTRRFAKRQFTWFRGQADNWHYIKNKSDKTQFEEMIFSKHTKL